MLWASVGLGAVSMGAGLGYLVMPRWRRRRTVKEPKAASRHPGGRIVVRVDKALDVRLPVVDVFAVWGHLENLPRFIPHLQDVRQVAIDRHRWTMGPPSEAPVEWDTRITRFGANRVIAWETMPGSVVRQLGSIGFRPNTDGSTRLSVGLTYVLPPGPFGTQLAALARAEGLDDVLRGWKASAELSRA